MAALREHTRREETFLEELTWRQDHGGKTTDGKRKREDKATTKPKKQQKTYTVEEKAAYKLQKKKERQGTNAAQTKKKVVNTDWATAHQRIKDSIVNDRKNAKQCPRCGFDRHTWAECYRPIQVSAIGSRRNLDKRPVGRWKAGPVNQPRRPQAAAVTR